MGGSSDRTKSLNIGVRRKENERIEKENHACAKRLYSNTGSISKKQLESDYKSILQYKKMIGRVKKNRPNFNGRFSQLPPLTMNRAASQDRLNEVNEDEETSKLKDKNSKMTSPRPETKITNPDGEVALDDKDDKYSDFAEEWD